MRWRDLAADHLLLDRRHVLPDVGVAVELALDLFEHEIVHPVEILLLAAFFEHAGSEGAGAERFDDVPQFVDALAGVGRTGQRLRLPAFRRRLQVVQDALVVGAGGERPRLVSPSALFTTTRSQRSMTPFLMPCNSSPAPAICRRRKRSTIERTVISLCPTPTVSTKTTSKPAASQTMIVSRLFRATPHKTPPDGDGRM